MKAYFRTLLGALVLSSLWFAFCFLSSVNWQLSLFLALLNLLIWPWFVPLSFLLICFVSGRVTRDRWSRFPILRDQLLTRVLGGDEIPVSLWIFNDSGSEYSFYPVTLPTFSGPRQVIAVSKSWLENSSDQEMEAEFAWVLKRLEQDCKNLGYLRLLQMCLWFGQIFWLEMALILLHYVMRIFGFEDLPRPAFWTQRLAWSLKKRWFGEDKFIWQGNLGLSRSPLCVKDEPTSWNYLSVGIWGYYSSRAMHPTWRILMDSESLIPG